VSGDDDDSEDSDSDAGAATEDEIVWAFARMVGEEDDDDDESEGPGGKEEGNGRYIKNSLGPDEETISAARGRLAKHFGSGGADSTRLPFKDRLGAEKQNKYYAKISSQQPTDLVTKFFEESPQRVQDAASQAVKELLGTIQTYAEKTAIVLKPDEMAKLIYRLQLTGYMFRNAEYRVSLAQSLRQTAPALPGAAEEPAAPPVAVTGRIRVRAGGTPGGPEYEVDADAYVAELRAEVEKLKGALAIKEKKEESDLLNYVRSLPDEELEKLSESISPEVQEAMKLLIANLFTSMGIELSDKSLSQALVQHSGDALAAICFWQLVNGYTLRGLETKDELERQFQGS
jgi:hypothetical protein